MGFLRTVARFNEPLKFTLAFHARIAITGRSVAVVGGQEMEVSEARGLNEVAEEGAHVRNTQRIRNA